MRQWVPQNVCAFPTKQTEFQKDTLSQSATTCEKIEKIERLYERSHRIEGTLAERYLQEHRGIRDGVLSPDLRFIAWSFDRTTEKSYPCLVAFARGPGVRGMGDPQGPLHGAQLTYLDEKTAGKAQVVDVQKRSLGHLKDPSFVLLQEKTHPGQPTYLAEGVETGLSLAYVETKGRILVSLGIHRFQKYAEGLEEGLHKGLDSHKGLEKSSLFQTARETVILCSDNDVPDSAANRALQKAYDTLIDKNIDVHILHPISGFDRPSFVPPRPTIAEMAAAYQARIENEAAAVASPHTIEHSVASPQDTAAHSVTSPHTAPSVVLATVAASSHSATTDPVLDKMQKPDSASLSRSGTTEETLPVRTGLDLNELLTIEGPGAVRDSVRDVLKHTSVREVSSFETTSSAINVETASSETCDRAHTHSDLPKETMDQTKTQNQEKEINFERMI